MLETITPLILTYNESANLERTLQQLTWAETIVVIDSYSTDETLDILNRYSQVQVFQNPFQSFADQCNYGLSKIESDWVLSLDADYVLSNELIEEMKSLPLDNSINGYSVQFKYCVFGYPLRGTLYPPRHILHRKTGVTYLQDGHAHRVSIEGETASLTGYVYHDDRKPLGRWLQSQSRYMVLEAKKLLETPKNELSLSDRIRRHKLLAPLIILIYCLIIHRGILDGWAGWYYAFQRVLAEILLSIHLIEAEKLADRSANS